MSFSLSIGDTHAIPKPLRDGDIVYFLADTTSLRPDPSRNGDNTSLNLLSGDGDFNLHISIRRGNQTIVFNSREADGGWGHEEVIGFGDSFKDGRPSAVSVAILPSRYDIFVDGALRHSFNKRLNVPIKAISYARNGDMSTEIFGTPIKVKIIHTLPPPSPSVSFSLSIGDTHALSSSVPDNDAIYFVSDTTSLQPDSGPSGDNTSLNLLSGDGDYLLHISIRRGNKTIVFNSRLVTGGWGSEEVISSEGLFKQDAPASVVVYNYSSRFDIIIGGDMRHSFTKRIYQPIKVLRPLILANRISFDLGVVHKAFCWKPDRANPSRSSWSRGHARLPLPAASS